MKLVALRYVGGSPCAPLYSQALTGHWAARASTAATGYRRQQAQTGYTNIIIQWIHRAGKLTAGKGGGGIIKGKGIGKGKGKGKEARAEAKRQKGKEAQRQRGKKKQKSQRQKYLLPRAAQSGG